MTTGQRIKAARKVAGMTQAELAQKLDIPFQSISQWERALRNPKRETLARIADALGVTVNDLLGQEEPDREYEDLCNTLDSVGLSIEAAGYGEGPDESGDHYYVWHTDSEYPEAERAELTYRDLLRIVAEAQKSADLRRIDYLRKRLDAELF